MDVKNPFPRRSDEIFGALEYLESQKTAFMKLDLVSAALAIGSQIEMLKWAYHMEEERKSRFDEKEEKKI